MAPPQDQQNRVLRELRLSLTDRCNMRCRYCMPAEIYGAEHAFLPKSELLNFDEILRLLHHFIALGVNKIRLTGGDPLLRRDVAKLVAQITRETSIPDLALSTNGLLLAQYAHDLADAGLHRVNISLDAIDNDIFQKMSGGFGTVERVQQGIETARRANLPIKLNMMVKRGINQEQIMPVLQYAIDQDIELRFIEYMDVGNVNGWRMDDVVTSDEILQTINHTFSFDPVNAPEAFPVARRYCIKDKNYQFGIIASVTQPFCGGCTRARLSSDGKLFTCLFSTIGHDLKTPLREGVDQEDLSHIISRVWTHRDDQYSVLRATDTPAPRKIEMSYIGG